MVSRDTMLRKLESFLSQVMVIDDAMPIQQLAVFLAIARREGLSIAELAKALGLGRSSASRNVAALGDLHWQKKPGLYLVEDRIDPMELRKKQIYLTPKGRRLLEQIEAIFIERSNDGEHHTQASNNH